ncbi:MAG: sigma-70 family RNA polymerase sigma factor [bacterium]
MMHALPHPLLALASLAIPLRPSPDQAEEQALIARARQGGADGRRAARELIETHQAWLVNLLAALLGNDADGEEVAQEVLVKAMLALETYRGEARLRTWLRRIAVNEAYNSRRRTREYLSRDGMLAEVGLVDGPAAAVESRQLLLVSLSALSYSDREILVLRYVEDLDLATIGEQLDIGTAAAKMRLMRARRAFAEAHDAALEAP